MNQESKEPEWYVVRSQTKRERLAAATLRDTLGIQVLAPTVKYRKVTRRGKVWWSEAMFPGYLFAKFDPESQGRAVKYAQGVMTIVKFGESMPAVPASFIQALEGQLAEEDEIVLEHNVQVGGAYEVASGPLRGNVGEVLEVLPGKERVRLLIEMLGQKQSIEVDLFSLLLPGRPKSSGN